MPLTVNTFQNFDRFSAFCMHGCCIMRMTIFSVFYYLSFVLHLAIYGTARKVSVIGDQTNFIFITKNTFIN